MNRRNWGVAADAGDLDQRIPPQLYVAVAELLAWIYQLESGGQKDSLTASIRACRQISASLLRGFWVIHG